MGRASQARLFAAVGLLASDDGSAQKLVDWQNSSPNLKAENIPSTICLLYPTTIWLITLMEPAAFAIGCVFCEAAFRCAKSL